MALCIITIIALTTFIILFNTPAYSTSTGPKNWLTGWNYRKSHNINGSPGAGTDYQIKIITHYQTGIDSGENVFLGANCQDDFSDIRFADNDGVTLLDHWLETRNNKDYAVFWVKVNDNLDSNQKVFIYYGNSTVSSASNMEKTFPFSDDFSSSNLDNSKWRTFGSGKVTIKEGNCILESVPGNYGWIYIHGKTFVETNFSIRFRSFMIERGYERWTHHGFATIYNTSDKQGGRTDEYPNYITISQEAQYYAWTYRNRAHFNTTRLDMSSKAPAASTFYIHEIQRNGTTNVLFNCNEAYQASIGTNVPTVTMSAMFSADNAGTLLYSVTAIDWVFIRKFVANEPQHGNWGTQEIILTDNLFGQLVNSFNR